MNVTPTIELLRNIRANELVTTPRNENLLDSLTDAIYLLEKQMVVPAKTIPVIKDKKPEKKQEPYPFRDLGKWAPEERRNYHVGHNHY